MSLDDRKRQFKEKLAASDDWTEGTDLRENFGYSNSTRVVEGGLFVCNVNLDRMPAVGKDQMVLTCMLTFPPQDEVFFAVYIRNEYALILRRLEVMLMQDGQEIGGVMYHGRNNNVRFYLADDGRLYMRNKDYWDSMDFDRSLAGPAPMVDKIKISLYPSSPSARRSLLAREFVGYLSNLTGAEKVHEIAVWEDDTTIKPEMKRSPREIPVAEIEESVRQLGGYYPGGEVRRFHAALNFLENKHFVILAGLSGTGKTQLALKYARAVHGLTSNTAADPFLFICPVRPEWTDPAGLTGYYDILSNRYVVPPFLEAVLVATAHRDSPVFVVLDEMNIARVEYYFSDVLSCIETGSPLQLHSNSVPIEGTTGTNIRAELPIPANLFITGTVNIDESTNPISDKVLDRASLINMTDVNIEGFISEIKAREPVLDMSAGMCGELLSKVHQIMSGHRLQFGYRVAEEVLRYHLFSTDTVGEPSDKVLDNLMVQKVFTKLRGSERQRPLLDELVRLLSEKGFEESDRFLKGLLNDLDEFGSFQASR